MSPFCRLLRDGPSALLRMTPRRGWRAVQRQSLECPRSFRIAASALRRATCALLVRYRASRYLSALQRRATSRAHAYLRRSIGTGPRFNPGLPVRDLTASSWRGLLVVPGGAPAPPECFVATRSAGAAPRHTLIRLMNAPLSGRGACILMEGRRGRIRGRLSHLPSCPALPGIHVSGLAARLKRGCPGHLGATASLIERNPAMTDVG